MAVWRATWTLEHPSLGGVGTNTWHARTTAVTDPGQLIELNALNAQLGALYVDLEGIYAGGTVIAFNGEWTRVDGATPDIVGADVNALVVGGTAAPLPPATALCIGWRTSVATKRGRGRTFLGPLNTACLQDDGTPTTATRTTVLDAALAFIDAFDDVDNGAYGVWSAADSVLRDFTQGRVADQFAVLRSRRD